MPRYFNLSNHNHWLSFQCSLSWLRHSHLSYKHLEKQTTTACARMYTDHCLPNGFILPDHVEKTCYLDTITLFMQPAQCAPLGHFVHASRLTSSRLTKTWDTCRRFWRAYAANNIRRWIHCKSIKRWKAVVTIVTQPIAILPVNSVDYNRIKPLSDRPRSYISTDLISIWPFMSLSREANHTQSKYGSGASRHQSCVFMPGTWIQDNTSRHIFKEVQPD